MVRNTSSALAWGDCLCGCIYDRWWRFNVAGEGVSLEAEFGDDLEWDIMPDLVSNSEAGFLDGEFSGTFPSGDGTAGGDFAMTFTLTRGGDTNWDQVIDVGDLVTLIGILADPEASSLIQRLNADVNGDGAITSLDFDQLLEIILNQ